MRITINRQIDIPIYMQIKNQIRELILSGAMAEGTILPPERKLADGLGVNRSTVLKAYQELKADALIGAHVGKGTVVLPQVFGTANSNTIVNPVPWNQFLNQGIIMSNANTLNNIMEFASHENMISFAAGIPSPEFYPVEEISIIQEELFRTSGKELLLQSPVEGYYPLRETICQLQKLRGINVTPKEVMILSGSQQGLDFISRAFLGQGDVVVVEEPTYLGAIQAFKASGARVMGVPIDKDGIRIDILESLLSRYRPKLIYTLPTFQNPTGVTMSIKRRNELLELAYRYQIPIVEDDPYGEISFNEDYMPSLKALDKHGYVIYLSTFSKTMFLGLRVGWITAPQNLIHQFALMKQSSDLHVNTLGQHIFDSYYRKDLYMKHLKKICKEYEIKRNTMIEALEKYKVCNVNWNIPQGGYYIWCKLPDYVNTTRLMMKAAKKGVAYIPGEAFYPDGNQGENCIRLNYTYPSSEQIHEGIKRLMEAIKETLDENKKQVLDDCSNVKPIV